MKLKDLKDKNGKALLPEVKAPKYNLIGTTSCYDDNLPYNQAISELSNKEIELDVEKIEDIINEVSENQIKPYVVISWKKGSPKCESFGRFFAIALSKADIIRVKEE